MSRLCIYTFILTRVILLRQLYWALQIVINWLHNRLYLFLQDKQQLEKWMQEKRKARMLNFRKERDEKIKQEPRPYQRPKAQPQPTPQLVCNVLHCFLFVSLFLFYLEVALSEIVLWCKFFNFSLPLFYTEDKNIGRKSAIWLAQYRTYYHCNTQLIFRHCY